MSETIQKYNSEIHPAKLDIQYEAEVNLQDRIDLLTSNGMVGLALVLLMLGLFLSTRGFNLGGFWNSVCIFRHVHYCSNDWLNHQHDHSVWNDSGGRNFSR